MSLHLPPSIEVTRDRLQKEAKEALELTVEQDHHFYPVVLVMCREPRVLVQITSTVDICTVLVTSGLFGAVANVLALCVVSDSFALTSQTSTMEDFADLKPGGLQAMFEDGDPEVAEALTVAIMSHDGLVVSAHPYERRGHKTHWLPTEPTPPEDAVRYNDAAMGTIPEAMRAVFDYQLSETTKAEVAEVADEFGKPELKHLPQALAFQMTAERLKNLDGLIAVSVQPILPEDKEANEAVQLFSLMVDERGS